MTISIPAGRTIALVPKAGGGFQSAGVSEGTTVTPLFADGFETGDVSKTENSFSWSQGTLSTVTTLQPRTGTYSSEFQYGPNASGENDPVNRNLAFFLTDTPGTGYQEVWFEYYWHIPSNFVHRSDGTSVNNKFFVLYADNYSTTGDIQTVLEFDRVSDSESVIRALCMSGSGCLAGDTPNSVIRPADIGNWVRIRVHAKAGNGDGEVEVWRDNDIVYSIYNYTHHFDGGNNYWRRGHLMGTSNSGYAVETKFHVDDFKVWTTDPQWSFQ